MIIDGNEIEKAAMKEFHKGNRKEGLRIQEEFASAFRMLKYFFLFLGQRPLPL